LIDPEKLSGTFRQTIKGLGIKRPIDFKDSRRITREFKSMLTNIEQAWDLGWDWYLRKAEITKAIAELEGQDPIGLARSTHYSQQTSPDNEVGFLVEAARALKAGKPVPPLGVAGERGAARTTDLARNPRKPATRSFKAGEGGPKLFSYGANTVKAISQKMYDQIYGALRYVTIDLHHVREQLPSLAKRGIQVPGEENYKFLEQMWFALGDAAHLPPEMGQAAWWVAAKGKYDFARSLKPGSRGVAKGIDIASHMERASSAGEYGFLKKYGAERFAQLLQVYESEGLGKGIDFTRFASSPFLRPFEQALLSPSIKKAWNEIEIPWSAFMKNYRYLRTPKAQTLRDLDRLVLDGDWKKARAQANKLLKNKDFNYARHGLGTLTEALARGIEIRGYNTGGAVGGYGSGDTVPALLTPGEIVLNRGHQRGLARQLGVAGASPSALFSLIASRFALGGVAGNEVGPLPRITIPGLTNLVGPLKKLVELMSRSAIASDSSAPGMDKLFAELAQGGTTDKNGKFHADTTKQLAELRKRIDPVHSTDLLRSTVPHFDSLAVNQKKIAEGVVARNLAHPVLAGLLTPHANGPDTPGGRRTLAANSREIPARAFSESGGNQTFYITVHAGDKADGTDIGRKIRTELQRRDLRNGGPKRGQYAGATR
jgi:hypothetical protein